MISGYSPPFILSRLFNEFIWRTSNNKILITFDDGPSEISTEKIISLLNEKGIRAAFFCVGENVKKYPELVKSIIGNGHLIANHTMRHQLVSKLKTKETIEDIESFRRLLKEYHDYDVKYFRPPHGRFNLKTISLVKRQNIKCVMWSLLSKDYENDLMKVKYAIDNSLEANSIIVFHDNLKASSIIEDSINYTIEAAEKRGFEFGEPEDCLR